MERARVLPKLGEWIPGYPEEDGEPLGVNEDHLDWIVRIRDAIAYSVGPRVHVGAHVYWYPVEGNWKEAKAPDILVAFGRPQEPPRSSYYQWVEDDIPPQIVMEVLSPANSGPELAEKRDIYARHGAEEYYEVRVYPAAVNYWRRQGDRFVAQGSVLNTLLPRIGIRFERAIGGLALFDSTGTQVTDYRIERAEREAAQDRAEAAEGRAEAAERARNELAAEVDRLRRLLDRPQGD